MLDLVKCLKCGEEKPLNEYGVLSSSKTGRCPRCKSCECERAKKWHHANKAQANENARKWKIKNADRVADYNAAHYAAKRDHHAKRYAKWASENASKRREYMERWHSQNPTKTPEYKKRQAQDPKFRIENAVRCRIWSTIVRGSKSGRRSFDLLGYSSDELKAHLERQFQRGMDWDNYGEWHIDHIVPLSSFDYKTVEEPDFRAAWALTNLRPLWAKENLTKHAKRQLLL